jgi:hypothetical protein
VCVNPTQARVNPTQVCVNPTQVCVNLTQACDNLAQVCINLTQACVNPTQVLGASHVDLAADVGLLATMRTRNGQFEEALPLLMRARDILVLHYGEHDPRVSPPTVRVRVRVRVLAAHGAVTATRRRRRRRCCCCHAHHQVSVSPTAMKKLRIVIIRVWHGATENGP